MAAFLGLVLTFYIGVTTAISHRATSIDFGTFFACAQSLLAGESIYAPPSVYVRASAPGKSEDEPVRPHPNLNPPLFALIFTPLTVSGPSQGYLLWTAISLCAGFASCFLIWRELNPAAQTATGLVAFWAVLLAYYPTYRGILLGQVTLIVFLPLTGAWLCARRGHVRLAGILAGVAVSLKVFVALTIVYFALQRRWRLVAWAVATTVVTTVVTLPAVGTSAYREYLAALASVTWFGNSWNASYASFFTRILGGSENTPWYNLPQLAHALIVSISGATILALVWFTKNRPTGAYALQQFDLGFGLTLVVMLLVSPLGWMYYFPWLLLPGYAAWLATRCEGLRSLRRYLLLAWALSTIPTSMVRAPDVDDWRRWFTTDSIYFYALVAFGAVLSMALRRVSGLPEHAADSQPINLGG